MNTESIAAEKSVPPPHGSPKTYRAGTLTYTLKGLVVLFLWLLWGDFAFSFFENIFGRFIPLYLKELNASNSLIGTLMGSVSGIINLLFLPGLSRWSDNTRSRLGRRRPFLLVAAPLTVLSMLFMGFAPEIADLLHGPLAYYVTPSLTLPTFILILVSLFTVSFHYFNMILCVGFNWLVRDVVPMEVITRFLSWFRLIGLLSATLFNWFVFPYILSHRQEICLGIGVFYLIAFTLMCLFVKEGDYPPPPPKEEKRNVVRDYYRYFRRCLILPIYRNFFIAAMIGGFVGSAGSFTFLFTTDTLKIDLETLGRFGAYGMIASFLAYPPMGWLCDRFQPIVVNFVASSALLVVTVLSYFFIHGPTSLLVFSLLSGVVGVGLGLGSQAMAMKLFPREEFAQFSSAANVFGVGIGIVGSFAVGLCMDLVGGNYRVAFLVQALGGFALIPLWFVYQDWKRRGGPENYVPPLPPES